MRSTLPLVNAVTATFECIYGRGCDGLCCQNGRPPVWPDEEARIEANLQKFLPHLRPEARALIEKSGFLSNRRKEGQRMLRVLGGWCVFFKDGCVLHKVGAEEGDKYRYKPGLCALFPLAKNDQGEWYVRQWGYEAEEWDVFCLDPNATRTLAATTLGEEVELAARFDAQTAAGSTGSTT